MSSGHNSAREAKRKKILEEAIKEFVAKGFTGANINKIAENSGIGKGTIYLYFKSKEDLYVEALNQSNKLWMEKAREIIDSNPDPYEALKEMLKVDIIVSVRRKELAQLWINSFFADNKRFSETAAAVFEEYVKLIQDLVKECIKKGIFREVDPRTAAYVLLGLNELLIAFYEPLFKSKASLDNITGTIQDMIFTGLEKK